MTFAEVAARDMAAAREAGWYQLTWHNMRGGSARKHNPARRIEKPISGRRRDVLAAIESGARTLRDIVAALPGITIHMATSAVRGLRKNKRRPLSVSFYPNPAGGSLIQILEITPAGLAMLAEAG